MTPFFSTLLHAEDTLTGHRGVNGNFRAARTSSLFRLPELDRKGSSPCPGSASRGYLVNGERQFELGSRAADASHHRRL